MAGNFVQVNKKAAYAAEQDVGSETGATLTKANLVPLRDNVSKTVRDGTNYEIPLLRGRYGANDFVTTEETQAMTVPTFPYASSLHSNGKAVNRSILHPLIQGSFHQEKEYDKDLGTSAGGEATVLRTYAPVDDPIKSTTLLYRYHKFNQRMVDAYGSTSFTAAINEAASIEFAYQSAYKASVVENEPAGGTKPVFGTPPVLSRFNTDARVSSTLSAALGNCIQSFSFNQNATINPLFCIGDEGISPAMYRQTDRAATGEITFLIDVDTLDEFNETIGGKKALSVPISVSEGKIQGLVVIGTKPGETFVFGSKRFKLGNPTEGEVTGTGSYTVPITFIPEGDDPDYEFGWAGDMS